MNECFLKIEEKFDEILEKPDDQEEISEFLDYLEKIPLLDTLKVKNYYERMLETVY